MQTIDSNDVSIPLALRERHYTVVELAAVWGFSAKHLREVFRDVPGVLCQGTPETRFKRGYVNIRIPQSVALRVYEEMKTGKLIKKAA